MKKRWYLVLLSLAFGVAGACDSGGGSSGGRADAAQDDVAEGEIAGDDAVADTGGVENLWAAVPGATLGDVTQVLGFEAAGGALYLTVNSPVSAGLFHMDRAVSDAGFAKIFEGKGNTLATEAGIYMALWENKAGSLVQVNLDGEAADLAFNFEQREIKRMIFTGGLLYLLSKNWEVSEYHVNRGSAAAMQWEQLGDATNETALGFHTDGETVAVVTVSNEVPLGLNCRVIAANAGEGDAWTPCHGFPQHLGDGPLDPYSVNGGFTGEGASMAGWFEILKTGQKSYEVQVGTIAGDWSIVEGLPLDRRPAAMLVAGGNLYVGYLGLGEGQQVFTVPAAGGAATRVGDALPETGHDKSGVVGLAADGDKVFALFQDYNAGGSMVTAYEFTGE